MNQQTAQSGLHALEVDVAHVVAALDDPSVQIVDCREPLEWQAAHLDGATLIPLDALVIRKDELDPYRPVIVVCQVGARSLYAAQMLTAYGFSAAKSMAGGLIAWHEAGHPLTR